MATLSPFIFKARYSLPTAENKARNARYVLYLGTREGVVLNEPENTSLNHLKYIHERPRSHGLFDQNGTADLKKVQQEISCHEGIVWRMLISLREDEAERINHNSRAAFEASVKDALPHVAEKMGISETNLRWAAAFHDEPGHPHCHLMVWEQEPRRNRGELSAGERRDVKKVFVSRVYAKERERLFIEKNFLRDQIRQGSREEIERLLADVDRESLAVGAELGSIPRSAPRLKPDQAQELIKQVQALSEHMPGTGRIALKYMPPEVKEEVNAITDWILSQPGFQQQVAKYLQTHKELSDIYTHQEKQVNDALAAAYNDLRNRVSQEVLKAAASMQKIDREFVVDNEKMETNANYKMSKPEKETQEWFKSAFHGDEKDPEKLWESPGNFNLIGSVWNGVWQTVQREKSKTEYQARWMVKQQEREEKSRKEARER